MSGRPRIDGPADGSMSYPDGKRLWALQRMAAPLQRRQTAEPNTLDALPFVSTPSGVADDSTQQDSWQRLEIVRAVDI